MVRSLKTIQKELVYLEYNYQHLRIKTIPYLEEKKKLEKEKHRTLKLDEHEYADILRKEKTQKKSKIEGKFTKDINNAKRFESRDIDGEIADETRV